MRKLLPLALIPFLAGCEGWMQWNTETNRDLGAQLVIVALTELDDAGALEAIKLDGEKRELAVKVCETAARILPQVLESDPAKAEELIALGNSVCAVFGVAVTPAPVVAPEPAPAPEVPV